MLLKFAYWFLMVGVALTVFVTVMHLVDGEPPNWLNVILSCFNFYIAQYVIRPQITEGNNG